SNIKFGRPTGSLTPGGWTLHSQAGSADVPSAIRGHRPLERPPAAPRRARRPRSQRTDTSRRKSPLCAGLRQQLMSDLSGHIGQPEITALEPKGQLGVVDAEQGQDGGLQLGNVDPVFGDVKSEFVGLANGLTALDAATSQPDRVSVRVMVTSLKIIGVVRVWRLPHRCAAKLAAPDHQRVFQHATLL